MRRWRCGRCGLFCEVTRDYESRRASKLSTISLCCHAKAAYVYQPAPAKETSDG